MESIIVNNILKSDFKREAEVQGFEVFDLETVLKIRKVENFLINKSLTQELSEEEVNQIEFCKSEVESLKSAYVIDDETLKKEIVFFRERDLEKAASHKYFKREGTPGNYKYYYTEAEYKQAKGDGESKEGDSKVKVYHSDKYDAKNSRKTKTSTVYPEGTEIVDIYDKGTDTYRATVPVSRFKDSKTDTSSTDKKKWNDLSDQEKSEINKESMKWWSSLSINEQKKYTKEHPFFGSMSQDYTRSHKTSIPQIYLHYKNTK